jgi:single-strand DNA-binding protein
MITRETHKGKVNNTNSSLKTKKVMETITGRVVANATVRTTKSEKKVTGFTIAINDSYRPKDGERVQITRYVECSYWRNAGIAEYLKKGTLVELFGRIDAGAYINKDGKAVGTLNFYTEQIKMLGKTTANGTERAESSTKTGMAYSDIKSNEEDDLPF